MIERLIYGLVRMAARRGLTGGEDAGANPAGAKQKARRRGVRGETYAYWYLRRQGYVVIARNFMVPGVKGEIDLVGYDGDVLAFVEVKTRSAASARTAQPELVVNREKQAHLRRIAGRFLAQRRFRQSAYRFDILAIECPPGAQPVVRLHKEAFPAFAV